MFKVKSRGNYTKTEDFFRRFIDGDNFSDLDRYGQMGVEALRAATPQNTGLTSESWHYKITEGGIWLGIDWYNVNQADPPGGPSVAVLIQYGHATRSGSYVLGEDYINPAMNIVFDEIVADLWKKVTA